MKKIIFIFFCLFFSLLHAEDVKQGLLNKLLAPGPVIVGHKELEKVDCLSCHDAGKGVPNTLCLSCHKEIKESIDKKNTFHGLSSLRKNCIECHSDHKGRNYDSTIVDLKKFNHDLTGHVLHGKHKEIKCLDCHKETRAKMAIRKDGIEFMGATSTCKSCHQKQDVHLFKNDFANKDCNSCHSETKWKDNVKFDHFLESKFKLEGKHADMACSKCHTPSGNKIGPSVYKWENLKTDSCLACHKPYHKDTLSQKYSDGQCSKCHEQKTWKIPKFDHAVTGLTLKGKHLETTCIKCHQQTTVLPGITYKLLAGETKMFPHKWNGLLTTCVSCHKDIHLSGDFVSTRFGKMDKCETCHNEKSFKESINFNHNLDTRFKVDGKHKELTCIKCHTNSDVTKKDSPRIYHFKELEKDNCVICHKNPHLKTFTKKTLEKKCASCHMTSSWKDPKKSDQFNHNTDTRFVLDGKHKNIKCSTCHKEGENKIFKFDFSEKQFCEACHLNVHKNQFSEKFASKSCLECHNSESFKNLLKFDHGKTNFTLEGKHADPKVTCIQCHTATNKFISYKGANVRPAGVFKFLDDKKGLCESCHKNLHIDQFSQKFSNNSCLECHTLETFKDLKKFDHSKTKFVLDGKHLDQKVTCVSCHKPTKEFLVYKGVNLRPKGNFKFIDDQKGMCVSCHTNVHINQFTKNTLASSCTSCHTTQTFHQRKTFDHDSTKFPLIGFHEKADCLKCHIKTNESFKALPKNPMHRFIYEGSSPDNCTICHKDVHKGEYGNSCKGCHSESKKWKSIENFHKDFLLTGVHYTLKCNECHKDQRRLGGMSEACLMCHQKDDRHHGSLPNCRDCHKQEFWEVTTFKHSLTSFPLRGSHRVLSCDTCHSNGMYQGKSAECASCHIKDYNQATVHKNNVLIGTCNKCHQQFTWSPSVFGLLK